jgi:hypothetical protein
MAIAIINAAYDADRIHNGKSIHHGWEAVIRGVLLLVGTWFDVSLFVLMASVFWIIFEFTLNMFRMLPFLYVGQTAWTDRMIRTWFPKNPEWSLFTIKLGILVVSIFINCI